MVWLRVAAFALASCASGLVVDFEKDGGALADKNNKDTWWANGRALNATLQALKPGDVLVIPNKTFYIMGGIRADNVTSVTIQIDGTLAYAADMDDWPRSDELGSDKLGKVHECWYGEGWENVTITSSGTGTMNGNGATWWGLPGVGYLLHGENRPRLFSLKGAKNILVEKIHFTNSPYWTFYLTHVDGLEVRYCKIDNRRTDNDGHGEDDLSAYNTDGFDVTGRNVWIHDSSIWTQDDCIAAKGNSQDMLFENIEASGLGLTIGSIGSGATVRNITFRNIRMHKTVKGIYTKFRGGPAVIEDVLYENIVMDEPSQYAIWIGPAQQSDSSNPCAAHPCSLCWPQVPGATCDAPEGGSYVNITLRNITVNSPSGSPGVVIANEKTPMQNVVFENVRINKPGSSPFGKDYYHCENVGGIARGNTWPVPPCFEDQTGTCVKDGSCAEDGKSCCSSGKHTTLHCSSGSRCGCVSAGSCVTYEEECCSGKGHKTLNCNAAIGYRCDSNSTDALVV